jgi:hypothetical protein
VSRLIRQPRQSAEEDARWGKLADAFLGEETPSGNGNESRAHEAHKRLEEEVQSTLIEFEEHSRKRAS